MTGNAVHLRFTVGQSRRQNQAPAVADAHGLQCRAEAGHHALNRKFVGLGEHRVEDACRIGRRARMVEEIALCVIGGGDEPSGVGHSHRIGRERRAGTRTVVQAVDDHRIAAVGFCVGPEDIITQHAPIAVLLPSIAPLSARLGDGVARSAQTVGEGRIVARCPVGIFGVGFFLFGASPQHEEDNGEKEQKKAAFHRGARFGGKG